MQRYKRMKHFYRLFENKMTASLLLLLLAAVAYGKPATVQNPMITEGLFEGDILGIDPDEDRNAVPRYSQRWQNGIIPYVIDSSKADAKQLILKVMRYIESVTCIKFKERSFLRDKNYIRIYKGTGCSSYVGNVNRGAQDVSLADGCDNFNVIMHELMHAIGFLHEHSRSDRDDYVIIKWENIEEKWYSAFRKLEPHQNRLLTPFDYNSIMLYGSRAFAKDHSSDSYTMVTKDGKYIHDDYTRTTMSDSDITRVKILYQC